MTAGVSEFIKATFLDAKRWPAPVLKEKYAWAALNFLLDNFGFEEFEESGTTRKTYIRSILPFFATMRFSSTNALRRRSIFTLLAVVGLLCVGGALFSRLRAKETREETQIAPGISLLSVSNQTPNGPLRFWLVKAQKPLWQLGLEVADARDINKKRSVREIARRVGATVAINGGFFAYDGAAVGAVKVGGEWHRLPWKSRTALMWDANQSFIGPISGRCQLQITATNSATNSATETQSAAFNGFSLPGSHAALKDGYAVLTRNFSEKYRLKSGEIAWICESMTSADPQRGVAARLETQGEIPISLRGFVVVARGAAAQKWANLPAPFLRWTLDLATKSPFGASDILGAGPRLIENSLIKTTEIGEEFRPDVIARGPRTAMGWDKDQNWLFLVADGRQSASVGLTIPETAALFQSLGATEAINLDGGSSTQLVIGGELINAPSGYDPVNPLRAHEVEVINALILKSKP